ncbi:hypothetical protein BG004_001276 [Podila humilis]|nr:hypothetical protein BG004_001276 [Podila humilis]
MGALLSRLRQGNESDYEKILSDLDSNIRKAELRLSAIKLREKRFTGLWLVYSILAWIGYTAVFAFYLHHEFYDDAQKWTLAVAPIVLGLPIIYAGRSVISLWFKRAQSNEESQLGLLRADQRLKVEELKKKTAYYSTKTLLERYDPSSQQQRVNGPRSAGSDARSINALQHGQQRPMQPENMMDPGLRQRTGLGVTYAQGVPVVSGPHGQAQGQRFATGASSVMPPGTNMLSPRGPHGVLSPQPNHQNRPFNQGPPGLSVSPPNESSNTDKQWYDKIVDLIVGDEGPDTKYALICKQCYTHNGLALPQEIHCNFFNPPRSKRHISGIPVHPSPDATLLHARELPLPESRDPSPSPSHRRPMPEHDEYDSSEHPGAEGARGNADKETCHDPSPHDSQNSKSDERSENSIEFVNNWHDSDMEHSENTEDIDTDDAPGYIVESGEGKDDKAEETKVKSKKKKVVKAPTRVSPRKKRA